MNAVPDRFILFPEDIEIESEGADPNCPECNGSGKVLDAPDRVLSGHPYWVPCPVCQDDSPKKE